MDTLQMALWDEPAPAAEPPAKPFKVITLTAREMMGLKPLTGATVIPKAREERSETIMTYWCNPHTGTCQERHGATLWTTTSLWEQITKEKYDQWVTARRAIWNWPREAQLEMQADYATVIGV